MKFSAALDVDLVACEGDDEVTVCSSCRHPTPPPPTGGERLIVLDRSGSMGGAPLEGAKRALAAPSRAGSVGCIRRGDLRRTRRRSWCRRHR